MSEDSKPFELKEEMNAKVKEMSNSCGVVSLCIVAPFAPLRIAPRRSLSARFSYPDEFVLEEFVSKIRKKFPEKEDRPPLYILIHSPGGTISSSYVVARILRNTFNKIVGFITHIAASGATILALSCDELIMGDISRLTGIDPHYETDDETVYALSVVRAFDHLQDVLGTKTLGEISYPYQHLVDSITAEKYNEATHTLNLVEKYAKELLEKAGYSEEEMRKVINGVLYGIEAHEEVITLDKAKEIGIRAKHFSEDKAYSVCWDVMEGWLREYYLRPSPVHIIRCCFPDTSPKKAETKSLNKKKNT